jgi:peptidoglycan/xylan/chitin deacetylase (PgdA/CDA1 family)
LPRPANTQSPRYAVTPQQFREQMSLLAAEGFTSLTLTDLRSARDLPPRSVLVTFDDGFADIYLSAWPIARELGIKLNLFLCTGLLSGENLEAFGPQNRADHQSLHHFPHLWRPLKWEEAREMNRAGVSLGFHSHTHMNFGSLSSAEITADTTRGLLLFEKEVGLRPDAFAFPYGHPGSYSTGAIAVLKEHGLKTFFTTEMGRTSLPARRPIARFVIHPEDDIRSFRRKLFGGYDWVGRVRRAAYSLSASIRPEGRASARA